MLILITVDNPVIERLANNSHQKYPTIFGDVYKAFQSYVPRLGELEDLFIIASHAIIGADGFSHIGEQTEQLSVLAEFIEGRGIIPEGYRGSIYLYICYPDHSVDETNNTASAFINKLRTYGHGQAKGYVCVGKAEDFIPLPGDSGWVEVNEYL